jgi:hypothetical protein
VATDSQRLTGGGERGEGEASALALWNSGSHTHASTKRSTCTRHQEEAEGGQPVWTVRSLVLRVSLFGTVLVSVLDAVIGVLDYLMALTR